MAPPHVDSPPFIAGTFAAASPAGLGEDAPTRVTVHVTEWEFTSVAPDSAPTGTVVFTIVNDGVFAHNFSVGGKTSELIPGGGSTSLTVVFDVPGAYTYLSTVDDSDREMWGGFTVTQAPPTGARPATTPAAPSAALPLRRVADVPLPGGTSRFDYQSVDVRRRRLFIAHLGDGQVLSFDLRRQRVAGVVGGVPDVRGVLAVPSSRRVYAAATGSHQLVTFDEQTLRRIRAAPAGGFPDGVAYDARDRLVFVSDVSGEELTVFRPSGRRIGSVPLRGSPGNVQYDARTGTMVVGVGSRDELAIVAPRTRRVTKRVRLSGCHGPHGVEVVSESRRAYVACEESASLVVVDLSSLKQRAVFSVGDAPDVLDVDPGLKRLYVASESGVVSAFSVGARVRKLGQSPVDEHAHSVAVDPVTHRVYLPLEDVGGRPVLRVLKPA